LSYFAEIYYMDALWVPRGCKLVKKSTSDHIQDGEGSKFLMFKSL